MTEQQNPQGMHGMEVMFAIYHRYYMNVIARLPENQYLLYDINPLRLLLFSPTIISIKLCPA
jgi:hypothetical protein